MLERAGAQAGLLDELGARGLLGRGRRVVVDRALRELPAELPTGYLTCPTSVTRSPSHGTTSAPWFLSMTAWMPSEPSSRSIASSRTLTHGFS